MQAVSRATATRALDALGWLLGTAVFAYLLAFPRVLGRADESIILDGARRVLQGQVLYKDFFEFITPGSFYLFAALFAATGPSLLAARVAMAAANSVSCVALYQLARRGAAAPEACVAVVLFATTCLPIWPYASPHWLSTTLCLATAAVLLSERWEKATWVRPAVVGALAGLTFCMQQHRGVFLGLWVASVIVAVVYLAPAGDRWRRCRRQLAWVAAGWFAVTVTVLSYSAWRASIGQVMYATFTFVFDNYYRTVHGTQIAGRTTWAGVCLLCGGFLPYAWWQMLRSFPAVLLVEALTLAWAVWRHGGRSEVIRGCMLLLAVLMSLSILYYPDFIHVAFIAPFALIVAARLAHAARSMLFWQRWRLLQVVPGLALAAGVLAGARKGWTNLDYAWVQAPERFESAVGTLHGTAADRQLLEGVRQVLSQDPSDHKTLFSYPADAWLYLAAPADNPTPFALMYPGFNSPEQFQEAIDALQKRPADCLVVNVGLVHESDPVVQFQVGRYQRRATVGVYEIYARRN